MWKNLHSKQCTGICLGYHWCVQSITAATKAPSCFSGTNGRSTPCLNKLNMKRSCCEAARWFSRTNGAVRPSYDDCKSSQWPHKATEISSCTLGSVRMQEKNSFQEITQITLPDRYLLLARGASLSLDELLAFDMTISCENGQASNVAYTHKTCLSTVSCGITWMCDLKSLCLCNMT